MCLDEVVDKWYEKRDEAGFQDYPYTWDGLLELLEDIECGVLANDLKNGLSSSQSSVKGNLSTGTRVTPGIRITGEDTNLTIKTFITVAN